MKVVWTGAAEKQLDKIYNFLARENVRAAADIYNTIIEEADRLALFPEMAARELWLDNKYRSLIVKRSYKVVYRFSKRTKEIIVVSVWDCRQNPKKLKNKVKRS